MKLCFTASSGGHLEEITCLRQITNENDSFLITEKAEKTLQQHGETELTFTTDQSQGTVFSYSFYQAFFSGVCYLEEGKAGLYHIHRSIDDISGLSVR